MSSFRAATNDDAGLISHIFATSWRHAYKGLIAQDYLDRLPDDYWIPSLPAWLCNNELNGLMVYDGKQPAGCCIYGRGREADHSDWGEIVSLYLLPDCMRKGLGGELLEECLSIMRKDGYHRFYLWAIEGSKATESFYAKHGFHPTTDFIDYSIGGESVRDRRYVHVEDARKNR